MGPHGYIFKHSIVIVFPPADHDTDNGDATTDYEIDDKTSHAGGEEQESITEIKPLIQHIESYAPDDFQEEQDNDDEEALAYLLSHVEGDSKFENKAAALEFLCTIGS